MKFIYLSVFIVLTAVNLSTQNKQQVTVTFGNILSDKGTILVSLHTKETFMKGPGYKNAKLNPTESPEIVFKDVNEGEYAFLVVHDLNDNGRIDFDSNGMPKEPYTTSSKTPMFGFPEFEKSKFTVSDKPVSLTLRF